MAGGGALDGLLVVALEQAVAAPFATSRLADAGVRVIKVERAEGDFARGYDRAAAGTSSYFAWRVGLAHASIVPYGAYASADGATAASTWAEPAGGKRGSVKAFRKSTTTAAGRVPKPMRLSAS